MKFNLLTKKVKMCEKPWSPSRRFPRLPKPSKFWAIRRESKSRLLYRKRSFCVCDIANLLGVSQSAVSHFTLRVLRQMKLVKFRRKGKIFYYSLDDEHISNLLDIGFRHDLKKRFENNDEDWEKTNIFRRWASIFSRRFTTWRWNGQHLPKRFQGKTCRQSRNSGGRRLYLT